MPQTDLSQELRGPPNPSTLFQKIVWLIFHNIKKVMEMGTVMFLCFFR